MVKWLKNLLLPMFLFLISFKQVDASVFENNTIIENHYQNFYKPDREDLNFALYHGYDFKSSHALTDEDIWVDIYSSNAILVDLTTNEVIYARNPDKITYPASLTKMMTVLVAIENLPSTEMVVDVDFNHLYEEEAALAGFSNGQVVSGDDLLYGTMLPSGADAALTLAKYVAGSEAGFVELMNQKAKELGMNHTHFTNVTGLHDDNHYSTVKDLAILVKAALYNDKFREVYSAKFYTTDAKPNLVFTSRMFDRLSSSTFGNVEILGGKTGFTYEAGLCLASYATDGNHEYALVTTHANGSTYTPQYHVLDAVYLYNYFLNQL